MRNILVALITKIYRPTLFCLIAVNTCLLDSKTSLCLAQDVANTTKAKPENSAAEKPTGSDTRKAEQEANEDQKANEDTETAVNGNSTPRAPESSITKPATDKARVTTPISESGENTALEIDVDVLDPIAKLQYEAATKKTAEWGHWGTRPSSYMQWGNHSNRLIPTYVFGGSMSAYTGSNSLYRHQGKIDALYVRSVTDSLNESAEYADQTDIYRLQKQAIEDGKKNIILLVMDGTDWQTTHAAATFKTGRNKYDSGRGKGLAFQNYKGVESDFACVVTSPYSGGRDTQVDRQILIGEDSKELGGYNPNLGGQMGWSQPADIQYPIGRSKVSPHAYTDSAASATSLTTGKKTYNGAINFDPNGQQIVPIARELQENGWLVGAVTSVPYCHATPAAAYANNVSRKDYQDIGRDMLGVASVTHRSEPLPGLDLVLGCGFGEEAETGGGQGENFIPGNKYLAADVLDEIDVLKGGDYVIVQRTADQSGRKLLNKAGRIASKTHSKLFGFFGASGGHLPYRTANGDYKPVVDKRDAEKYSAADVFENPTLADMTETALDFLSHGRKGFWLMVEAGDVDWANHSDNIDNAIGSVLSAEAAFKQIVRWVEKNDAWEETLVIVTADHGHYLNITDPETIARAGRQTMRQRRLNRRTAANAESE